MTDTTTTLDVSVVLPCLNEAESVGDVVRDALQAMRDHGLRGEVVVADNASVDGSADVARDAGARVVLAVRRGYGAACHAGMEAARGRVLVLADADGTYPMEAIPALVEPVLCGDRDMVIGARIHDELASNAMPWAHRHIGTPLLTRMVNRISGANVSDSQSGMRAIDSAAYRRLAMRTPGMEYASEMILRAARLHLRIGETPIGYRERVGLSKLRTIPDGWRHLRYILLASPNWLFLVPGLISMALGLIIVVPLSFGEVHIGRFQMIIHPMFAGAVLLIAGYQMVQFGVLLRAVAPPEERDRDRLVNFVQRTGAEKLVLVGLVLVVAGVGLGITITAHWITEGFGQLAEVRHAMAASVLFVLGSQTIFAALLSAFFISDDFGRPVWLGGQPRRSDDEA
jgi:glycosyltransferase involved in cell wall biosynthesis